MKKRQRRNAVQLNVADNSLINYQGLQSSHTDSSESEQSQVTGIVTQVAIMKCKKRNHFPRTVYKPGISERSPSFHPSLSRHRDPLSEFSRTPYRGDSSSRSSKKVGRVRTRSGQFAQLVAEAIDGKEVIGVLIYEETQERAVRRKASFTSAPTVKQRVKRGLVRTKSGHNAMIIMTGEDDSETVAVLEYPTGERVLRRDDSYFIRNRMRSDEKPLPFKTPVRSKISRDEYSEGFSSTPYLVAVSSEPSDSPDTTESSEKATPHDIFVRRDSTSCQTPEIAKSVPSGPGTSLDMIDEPDSEEVAKKVISVCDAGALSDSDDFFEESSELLDQSESRLGWIGEEDTEELFGLTMTSIKHTSREFWRRQKKLLGPQRGYLFQE